MRDDLRLDSFPTQSGVAVAEAPDQLADRHDALVDAWRCPGCDDSMEPQTTGLPPRRPEGQAQVALAQRVDFSGVPSGTGVMVCRRGCAERLPQQPARGWHVHEPSPEVSDALWGLAHDWANQGRTPPALPARVRLGDDVGVRVPQLQSIWGAMDRFSDAAS